MNTVGATGRLSPLAGKLAPPGLLVDVARLIDAYYAAANKPDPAVPAQRVAFGTSGHRGSSFTRSFNEDHILAITQAICLFRTDRKIDGPLFLGIDTHALSGPAGRTALEVLAANGVEVMIAEGSAFTPTPVISHAILACNRARGRGRADGIVITPSHNPPQDGGFKYNPPNGGPADTTVTAWIEAKANALLETRRAGVKRISFEQALRASTTHRHDYLKAYVDDLANVIDFDAVRRAKLRLGVDPLGGAGVHYWPRIAERYGLDLTVVNPAVDPTFRFMTVDWDGQIRMDPSSPCAMAGLVGMKDRFDLSFACDTDHDRHGIVTRSFGLLPPNHYLCAAISYLFRNRPRWSASGAVGKTIVSTALIDRVAAKLGRSLFEVPVGFKWFVGGLLDGSLVFAGEESAGATFARLDGTVWTTDKDGFVPSLLAAEMLARTGCDPGESYRALTHELGETFYARADTSVTPAERAALGRISRGQIALAALGGEEVRSVVTIAPGNQAPIGGLKIELANGWLAARPSGTEEICKIYAESFVSDAHLRRILAAAQTLVRASVAAAAPSPGRAVRVHQPTEGEAVEAWENEGNPN